MDRTTGFYFDGGAEASDIYRLPQEREYIFCGVVKAGRDAEGLLTVEQREINFALVIP